MESSNRNVVMELGKRKAAVVSLRPMKRARSISLASLPQEATKSMEVYKIKSYRPKQLLRDFKKNFQGRLVADEMIVGIIIIIDNII